MGEFDNIGSFQKAFQCFIDKLMQVAEASGSKDLMSALSTILGELLGKPDDSSELTEFLQAVAAEDPIIIGLLTLELNYFCSLEAPMDDGNPGSGKSAYLNKADTIKQSIEYLVENLPPKVKKLLHILNELISLLR